MNDLTPSSQPFNRSPQQSALALELAKIMKLVAPVSMSHEAHLSWLASAVDALDDISPAEVAFISTEIRRSITRPSQIVPEIARLVSEKRNRANTASKPASPFMAEMRINREAQERRAKAKTQGEVESAWEWERNARFDAGLPVPPIEPALSRAEIARMPAHVVRLGLQSGFLKHDGDSVVEVNNAMETDRLRESMK